MGHRDVELLSGLVSWSVKLGIDTKGLFDCWHATLSKNRTVKWSGITCEREGVESLKILD